MDQQNQKPTKEATESKPSVKTNWKYIAIVAVFALIALGGILLLKTLQPAPVAQVPQPSPTPSLQPQPVNNQQSTIDTTSWQTYRNEKFNVEFKYPLYWVVEEYDETTESVINANHVDFSDDTEINLTYSLRFGFIVNENPNRLPLREYLIQEKVNIMYPLEFDIELSREEIRRRLMEWRVTTFKGYDSLQNLENTKLFVSVGQNVFMLYMDSLEEGINSFADSPFDQILSTFRFIEPQSGEGAMSVNQDSGVIIHVFCTQKIFDTPCSVGGVVVKTEGGVEVTRQTPDNEGMIQISLTPGNYTIVSMSGSSKYPVINTEPEQVKVQEQKFTEVNIYYWDGRR